MNNHHSLMEISNDDNQWAQQPDQIEIEIPEKCNLCFSDLQGQSHSFKTIEKNFNLCNECNERKGELLEFQSDISVYDTLYSKKIKIIKSNHIAFYNLKKGPCEVCCEEEEQILIKLNNCNHYCCSDCLKKHIYQNLTSSKKLLCTNYGCSYEINDYLIISFLTDSTLKTWNKFSYTQFCFSKKCPAEFTLNPYGNLEQNNVYELNNQMCCKSCKKQYCKVCWTKHKGQCNFEKLFEQYKEKNNIINCPYCNSLGLPQICPFDDGICSKFQVKSQQCFVCKKQFCLNCKGQLQLYESTDVQQVVTCQVCKQKHKSCRFILKRIFTDLTLRMIAVLIVYLSILSVAVFLACGFLIVIAIYISIYQLFQVSKWVWNFTKAALLPTNSGLAIAIFPLLLIFMAVAVLLIYVIGFLPMLVINVRRYFNADEAI